MEQYLVYRKSYSYVSQGSSMSNSEEVFMKEIIFAAVTTRAEANQLKKRLESLGYEHIIVKNITLYTYSDGNRIGYYSDELQRAMLKPEFFGKTKEELEIENQWKASIKYFKDSK